MAKKKKRGKKGGNTPPPGIGLEQSVARIQQMMDPNSTVTHNETLEDRTGNLRQFDVVIRGTFAGRPILAVVECKDHSRRKGPDAIEAFAKKAENVGANLRMMVSAKGFTKQALRLARHEGVCCLSLLPKDPGDPGLGIGHFWYGVVRKWDDLYLSVGFPFKPAPDIGNSPDAVLWRGLPAIRWFLRELYTTHSGDKEPGTYWLRLRLPPGSQVEIGGTTYPVTAMACLATWVQQNKRKWVTWSGEALYDWHQEAIHVPGSTALTGGVVDTDPSTWEDFDGPMPTKGNQPPKSFTFVLNYGQRLPEGVEIPDLAPPRSGELLLRLAPDPAK